MGRWVYGGAGGGTAARADPVWHQAPSAEHPGTLSSCPALVDLAIRVRLSPALEGNSEPHTESQIQVRYAETDAMGIAHHAEYLVWFEVGRSDYMTACGTPYQDCEAQGIHFPVAEAHCRYLAPARYRDWVVIETHLREMRSRRLTIGYRARRPNGELLAEGSTLHVCVDDDGRVRSIPDHIRQALRRGPLAVAEPLREAHAT